MFEVGGKAIVNERIIRKDGKAVAYPGDIVEVTDIFETKTAHIVNIKSPYARLQMIDIVVFKGEANPALTPHP